MKWGNGTRSTLPALLALALMFYSGCSGRVASAQKTQPPIVEVAQVIQKDIPVHGEWVGTLQGYLNARISPQVSGYLIRQDYQEGGLVQEDQVLF